MPLLTIPIIETATIALFFALFFHMNDLYAKAISNLSKINGHNNATCSPCVIEFVVTKANEALVSLIYSAPFTNQHDI